MSLFDLLNMDVGEFLRHPFDCNIFEEEEDEDTFYGHLYCFGSTPKKEDNERNNIHK